jgi:hypothetical protein
VFPELKKFALALLRGLFFYEQQRPHDSHCALPPLQQLSFNKIVGTPGM